MCKARHLRNYITQEIGYNVEFQFDYNADVVRATFSCSDDYADTKLCHNADDLTEYIIRRYGAFLLKENLSTPKNFAMDMKKICEILTNPNLQGSHKDSYQDEYTKILTRAEYFQLRIDCKDIAYDKIVSTSSYSPDTVQIRLGIWQGKK
jgi:hypothetical protein